MIIQTETTIGTDILAFITQIQRSIQLNGFSETLLGKGFVIFAINSSSCDAAGESRFRKSSVLFFSEDCFLHRIDLLFQAYFYFIPLVFFKNIFKTFHSSDFIQIKMK
jgi:hypothetical protein